MSQVYSRIVKGYLERIGVDDTGLIPDRSTLALLQRRHLLTVPFENLDIHWQRPILINTARFYEKIVEKLRGGFCYELNGLFNELLRHLGYDTRLVSARVFSGREHGPDFDHAAIIATIGEQEYLVDVGFGAFTAEPLRIVLDEPQQDPTGTYVIRRFEDEYFEVARREDGAWLSEYIFKDIARDLEEFAEMCDFQQYSPESHFRKARLCSIMTESGRKTLTDKSFIITKNGEKKEFPVSSDDKFYEILEREFGIKPGPRVAETVAAAKTE